MTPERWRQLEQIFHRAMEEPRESRRQLVANLCGEDDDLRREVERLLGNYDQSTAFLEPPRLDGAPPEPALPERIGPFRVVRAIASGGMGIVYEAEQDQPHRTVALKVVRNPLASPWALRRFRHEAEILARLRHPAIAQVYEAGTYGPAPELPPLPYFAMEFVEDARDLVRYAADEGLSSEARLRLFIEVCGAVHHGNRLGIVHRDIKPANILVDRAGRPKVIDFGLARAIDPDSAAYTAETAPGQIVGTLAYMSPEHLAGDPHDIDTRSDVYALGVVLYELLCGRPPHDVRTKPLAEAARLIQTEPPPRPSLINRAIRGELETIILKALEKDRERRYQSAADLAADLERYLRHEPIEARPPTTLYRLRKFVRRRWAIVTGVSIAAAALAIAAVVSIAFALREARIAREEARQRAIAHEVAYLLDQTLASADPSVAQPDLTVRELLDRTAADIEARAGQLRPETEATVRTRLGRSYFGLGAYREARRELEAADAAAQHAPMLAAEERLGILESLSRACLAIPDPEAALQAADRAADLARRTVGTESLPYATALRCRAAPLAMLRRFDEAKTDAEEALRLRERLEGPESPALTEVLSVLAAVAQFQRRLDDAEQLMNRAVAVARKPASSPAADLRLARSLGNLGVIRSHLGRTEAAVECHREALAILSRRLPPHHQVIRIEQRRLALALDRLERYDEALALARQQLDSVRAAEPDDPITLALACDDVAGVLVKMKRDAEAEPYLRESVELRRSILPTARLDAAGSLEAYADVLLRLGRATEAAEHASEAYVIRVAEQGAGHVRSLMSRSLMGACLAASGREAEGMLHMTGAYEGLVDLVGEADERAKAAAARIERAQQGVSR